MYTRAQWATAFLRALGNNQPDIKIVQWVVNWTVFETATGTGAAYNLLNTTQTAPGSTRFNSVGVQNFVSFQQGTATNARVLQNGFYPDLYKALRNNQRAPLGIGSPPLPAINKQLTTWGTGPKATQIAANLGAHMADEFSGTTTGSGIGTVQGGPSNTYPRGQCTWWADERFHQIFGYYVPWGANAKDWPAAARRYSGWNVSNLASPGAIIVLQPNVQGSDRELGHVGIVEKINNDGSLTTSNQNWAGITYPRTALVIFQPGAGVSFITAGQGSPINKGGPAQETGNVGEAVQNFLKALGAFFGLGTASPAEPILQQVHQTLTSHPGFYGMALALDEVEQFPGWQNLASGPFDVIGIIRSIGASVADNFLPAAIRGSLIGLGLLIVVLLLIKVVLSVGDTALQGASVLLPLIGG